MCCLWYWLYFYSFKIGDMSTKYGVVVFPGSNCDDDLIHVLGTVFGKQSERV